MEKNKYFTPNVEDICVGYMGEFKVNNNWGLLNINSSELLKECIENKFEFRTPFLTKEQIEDEGWKLLLIFPKGACVFQLELKKRVMN